ncbi:MAG: D-alanine--D-alanine ligase family protein [Chloroflexota bacterium]
MRIALLANLKQNAPRWPGMAADRWDDLDSPRTIDAILGALRRTGNEAEFFEASILPPHSLIEKLMVYKPDLCFNIAEGHWGDGREAQIPAVLEMLRIPYTGSQVMTLALSLDKPMTKRVLTYHGLPTPEFQVFERASDPINRDLLDEHGQELRFPLFVKPSREGTSVGISASSVVRTVAELRDRVAEQLERYNQPILVEHYIHGRELTVGIIGNLEATAARRINERTLPLELPPTLDVFPPMEILTEDYDVSEAGIYTNRIKTELADDFRYRCPADIPPALDQQLRLLAAAVFRVTGCKDVARVDFRLDSANGDKPYILEVNPLPGLNPAYSDLCLQTAAVEWSYDDLIQAIVTEACWRYDMIKSREHHAARTAL